MVHSKLDYVDVTLQNNCFTQDCKYYNTTQFADLIKSNKKEDLTLMHFNTRSLIKNKDKIESLLFEISSLPDLIAITETKLNSFTAHLASIEHYNFSYVNSMSNAGGVGIYIKKDLKYNVRTDIKIDYDDCESLFIKIVNNCDSSIVDDKRKTIIGVIYRHPRYSYELFQEELCKAIIFFFLFIFIFTHNQLEINQSACRNKDCE